VAPSKESRMLACPKKSRLGVGGERRNTSQLMAKRLAPKEK